jgi:hypothetical protein
MALPQASEAAGAASVGHFAIRDAAVALRTRVSPSIAAVRIHPGAVSAVPPVPVFCRLAGRACPRLCDVCPFHVDAWRRYCVV